jgi:hypothetical protein
MICPDCHGLRHAVIRGPLIPCASCGGCGIASCSDGAVGCGLNVVNEGCGASTRLPDARELDHEPQHLAPPFCVPSLGKLGMASPGGISEHSDVEY